MKVEEVRQGTVLVLKPVGAIIEDDMEVFRRAVDEQLSNGNTRLVLDFSEVPFIDSQGLEALLDLSDQAQMFGGGIRIANCSEISRDILVATRMIGKIQVFDEVPEARKSFL